MAKLEHLDISYNKLTFIPNEIKYMTRYICTKTNSLMLGRRRNCTQIISNKIDSVSKLIQPYFLIPQNVLAMFLFYLFIKVCTCTLF